jgi:hypothetical protein
MLNHNAFSLVERFPEKISWVFILKFEGAEQFMFNIDYNKMKQTFQPISKEIIEYVFHPIRLQRFANRAELDVADYLDLL